MKKKNILFIGAFNKRNNKDLFGGQLFACKSILESNLSKKNNFIKICSCQRSIPPPNILIRIYDSLIRLLTLLRILILNKINIALIFTSDGLGFIEKGIMTVICKKFNVKTILYPRSGLIINDVKNVRFKNFLKYVLENTNVLITQGKSWMNFYKGYNVKNIPIKIQQNWIDFNKYKIEKREFDKNELNILFLGWVDRNKGIFDLLLVFKKIVQKKINLKLNLLIAGKGRDFNLVKFKIEKYNLSKHVRLLGWVNQDKKLQLLKKSDIYVCPSYFEGFPNSLLECMASGIPSISTNVGSIPDVILNGKNGFLYDPGNIYELESLIVSLLNNSKLRKKISVNCQNHIKNNNTIEVASTMLDEVFKKI